MFTVELDIFSGRPNPRWELTQRESQQLLERLKDDRIALSKADDTKGNLGYRGFIVSATDPEAVARLVTLNLPREFRLQANLAIPKNISMESYLLASSGADIPSAAADVALESIQRSSTDGLTGR